MTGNVIYPTRSARTGHFPIVAIGAGDGGLDALKILLESLSPDTGLAFVFAHHGGNEYSGVLPTILRDFTKMKVLEARHQMEIEPNCVYILPGRSDLQVIDGLLFLNSGSKDLAQKTPINNFFNSLAHGYKDGIIGVVLSGSGTDGTEGLKAIKISGGIAFAQDESAQVDQMPRSAMAEGVVDFVLSPAEIAREVETISRQANVFSEMQVNGNIVSDTDEYLVSILQLLKKSTGIDFLHYKVSTIKRRIIRRMLLYKLANLKDYLEYLKRHAAEITVLYQDLLINVTCFFRDVDAMEFLKKSILPAILRSKETDETVRIWVPACSTGEEAYSLAMLLVELQDDAVKKLQVQIFGTDLSETAIAKARGGIYTANELADISEARLGRFFTRSEGGSYRVNKNIRDLCIFAHHNVFKDPPFSRLDLISCCNFFIYLDAILQQKCIGLFYFALNQTGYLVLGKSETISPPGQQLFAPVEKKYKVYIRKENPGQKAVAEVNFRYPLAEKKEAGDRKKIVTEVLEVSSLEKAVDDILYSRYVPATVLINQEMEILQFRGSTSLFLEPSRGKASFNLMKMIRPDLLLDLRNCIHKAVATGGPSGKRNIKLMIKDDLHIVSLHIIPLASTTDDKLYLIIFEEERPVVEAESPDFSREMVVQKLQEELNTVRNDMRSIIEEQEASKEQLQSANEEIISSNEELQSINEELETSKEEVESANEELIATNTELQLSNDQLTESKEYAEAIFETIREAVVVLAKDFRIRMANASFYRTFGVGWEETEGASIYDIGEGQWNTPKIRELLNNILHHDAHFDGYEIQCHINGKGNRTMLLNGRKVVQKANKQELMLLAFEDITDRRIAEKMTAEREEWFRNMANNAPVMIWTAGPDGLRNFFNVTWLTYTGRKMDQEVGDGWINDIFHEDVDEFLSIYQKAFQQREGFKINYRLRRADGAFRWVQAIGKPTFSTDDQFTGFVGICAEVHDSKVLQEELERQVGQRTRDLQEVNKELTKSNTELQQFAYVASHDLQEPLRKILMFSDRLTSRGNLPEDISLHLAKISGSAQRMSMLIRDVLDFSGAVKANHLFVSTDLKEVLDSILQDFDAVISRKNAIVVARDLPVIDAIPLQMGQLFHNILSNALKFSKPGVDPVITITAARAEMRPTPEMAGLDPGREYVEIIFEDNGIGFSNEFAEQIFVLFQRLHARYEFSGTGIGLALCKKIVENHGGVIYARSIEHIRTEFHVILPVVHTAE